MDRLVGLLEQLFDNPVVLGGVAVVLVLLVAWYVRSRRRSRLVEQGLEPQIERLLAQGNYTQAGSLAARHGRLKEGIEFYMRAQQPARAAQLAVRLGDARRAAELYEVAEDYERAAYHYDQAGLTAKARELRENAPVSAASVARGEGSLAPGSRTSRSAPEAESADSMGRFRSVQRENPKSVEERARFQELAAEAAEELLNAGEIRQAAEVYRDAGLQEEAVHLYVNVLGAPGEAAPLVAAMGNHERAAELYELAGKKERAAALWARIATESDAPLRYIDRIEELSLRIALELLERLAGLAPLNRASAETHYRLARALERGGDKSRAIDAYEKLRDVVGDYKDVAERMKTLVSAGVQTPATKPAAAERNQPPPLPGKKRRARQSAPRTGGSGDWASLPAVEDGAEAEGASVSPAQSLTPGPRPLVFGSSASMPALQVEQISAIARQAAEQALEQAARSTSFRALDEEASLLAATPRISKARRARGKPAVISLGLERVPHIVESLVDSPVRIARDGPTIASLRKWTYGQTCSLQNIEVFYRLGLAYLAAGRWPEAREAFAAVEEASPGYRDAERRAQNIAAWMTAVGTKMEVASTMSLVAAAQPSQPAAQQRYRILGELGRGGMAVVYRAKDEVLGRDVALKFISEEYVGEREFMELFQREARAAGQLNHPNVVTIYDFGIMERRAFLCMEYMDGVTAEQLIDQRGCLTVVEALRITQQVLKALEYAHGEQIVHRDIKPSNVMRTSSGVVKLMDFGLAKSVKADAKASIVAGTPAYMAPEQALGKNVDHRADLFAVAASLYEMLSGSIPFQSVERNQAPVSLLQLKPELPEVLDRIVAKALDFDPGKRFQSASEFASPIARILQAVEAFQARQNEVSGEIAGPSPERTRVSATPDAKATRRDSPAAVRLGTAPTVVRKTR